MTQERERYDGLQRRFANLERTSAGFETDSEHERRARIAAEERVRALGKNLKLRKLSV